MPPKSKSSKSKSKEKDKKSEKSSSKSKKTTSSKNNTKNSKNSKNNSKTNIKSKDKKKDTKNDKDIDNNNDILAEDNNDEHIVNQDELLHNLSGRSLPHKNSNDMLTKPDFNTVHNSNKCEGCFNSPGYVYCNDCNRIYCKICDDQLHIVPAFRDHERENLETFNNIKNLCYYHSQNLTLFCETCQEPICKMCQVQGPHCGNIHKITSVFIAYRKLMDKANTKLNGPLKEKYDKIEKIMSRIEQLLKENKQKATMFLKEINNEYETIINKIENNDGQKRAILSYSSSEIQKDMIDIKKVLEYMDELVKLKEKMKYNANYLITQTQPNFVSYNTNNLNNTINLMTVQSNNTYSSGFRLLKKKQNEEEQKLEFLLKYNSFVDDIERLLCKPTSPILSKEEELKLLTFPKELNQNKIKLESYNKMKKILEFKEDIIGKLKSTPYEENDPEFESINIKKSNEINKWRKLVDSCAYELQQYNLVCAFCGCPLHMKMNENCPINEIEENNEILEEQRKKLNKFGNIDDPQINYIFSNLRFTVSLPDGENLFNGRHYFADVSPEYEEKIKKGDIFDPSEYVKKRRERKERLKREKSLNEERRERSGTSRYELVE